MAGGIQIIVLIGLTVFVSGHLRIPDSIETASLKIDPRDLKDIDKNVFEDTVLTCPELVEKYGYPSETHTVETNDGYILEMHRIAKPGGQPVLLMHGLLDSSSTWVIMGPNKGFGYMLSDLGYDVWMGNVRGTRYSRKHKSYNPDFSSKYWDFSVHELGTIDIPTMVDYVLKQTGFPKLHYVGHSQGNLEFWIAAAENQKLNDKILSVHALAPVAYSKNVRSPLVNIMSFFMDALEFLVKLLGIKEFAPKNEIVRLAGEWMCQDGAFTQDICASVIFVLCGYNKDQLNNTMLPVIGGHAPAGASTKQMFHYGQLKRSGYFRQFDYGWFQNLIKYKQLSPPDYDLSKVTAKAALYYSDNDWLSDPKDVTKLHSQLPNAIGSFMVGNRFNHLDFVWGIDAKEILFDKVVKIMDLVERGEI